MSCPCHSQKNYDTCCQPYHEGKLPENALVLMRSRYSAYAMNLPNYIVSSTHPASPQYRENHFSWKREIADFCKGSRFKGLEILSFKERERTASVVFIITLIQKEKEVFFTEKSFFEKFHDRWFYRLGQCIKGREPSMVDEGPLKVLPLSYYGEPILRRKGDIITEITPEVLQLIEDMKGTMNADSNGVGLAAPQVGQSLRLFMIKPMYADGDPYDKPQKVSEEINVFINPTLLSSSKETWEVAEGCLSVPTIYAPVQRPKEITMSYLDEKGTYCEISVNGWESREILHEYDHIEGVLFPDRLSKKEFEKIASRLNKLEKRILS